MTVAMGKRHIGKRRRVKSANEPTNTNPTNTNARQTRGRKITPPLREMPACLKNRKPGEVLNNSQCIEVLEWMSNCLNDAAVAAGLRV